MNAMMMKEMATNKDTDGFAALGAMLASTMVDKMIDGFVTPEGMTMMMQGKDLKASSTVITWEHQQSANQEKKNQARVQNSLYLIRVTLRL